MPNQATAKIVLDSLSPDGYRLTTFQLRYWRPIHSELMTHRVFSRNAGSSRARPSMAIIDQVHDEPWGPIHWGSNKPGMQAGAELTDMTLQLAKADWEKAARNAANVARDMLEKGLHKQVVNRILEPFTYIDVLVTATDWANWFALRDHPAAQPEIQELARLMKHEYQQSIPEQIQVGQWHLPYITEDDWKAVERYCQIGRITRDMPSYQEKLRVILKISTARCARVSYKAFDGKVAPIEKDIELYEQLLESQPVHASPAEHQATPDHMTTFIISRPEPTHEYPLGMENIEKEDWISPDMHGNLRGWMQHRKFIPNEYLPG